MFGCHPYLTEDRYRDEARHADGFCSTTWRPCCIDDSARRRTSSLGPLGTRFDLRLAMLQYPLRCGTDAEVRWLIAETDALMPCSPEAAGDAREQMVDETRRWVMRDCVTAADGNEALASRLLASCSTRFGEPRIESGTRRPGRRSRCTLLWQICRDGVHGVPPLHRR